MQKTEMLMKFHSTQLSRKIFSYLFPVPSFQKKSHLTRLFLFFIRSPFNCDVAFATNDVDSMK